MVHLSPRGVRSRVRGRVWLDIFGHALSWLRNVTVPIQRQRNHGLETSRSRSCVNAEYVRIRRALASLAPQTCVRTISRPLVRSCQEAGRYGFAIGYDAGSRSGDQNKEALYLKIFNW
jgi:hypothetical protein